MTQLWVSIRAYSNYNLYIALWSFFYIYPL